jgi:hypothetical protein
MKNQRLLIALTLANLSLLCFLLTRVRADDPGVLPVLRGSALEIVDETGKVRAELRVFPIDPRYKLPNGDPYPETVLLRLIDSNGRPAVKISAAVPGGGLYLGGADDPTMARLAANGTEAELLLKNQDGKERRISP